MVNSKYILVVEGDDDKEALKYILPKMSEKIGKAIKQNLLTIHELGGASSLSYSLSLLKNMLCSYVVLLDDDDAGRKAFNKADKDNLIKAKDVTFTTCIGMTEAEFEDCLKPTVYQQRIKEEFGCDLSLIPDFKKVASGLIGLNLRLKNWKAMERYNRNSCKSFGSRRN